jgi:hypothetical protein
VDWEVVVACGTAVVVCGVVVACANVASPVVVVVPVCAPVVPVVGVVVPVAVPVVVSVVPVVAPVVVPVVPLVGVATRSSWRFATAGPFSPLIPRWRVAFEEELSIASILTLAHSCSSNTFTTAPFAVGVAPSRHLILLSTPKISHQGGA